MFLFTMLVFMIFVQAASAPPKKPPRRNLSASPPHPGMPDLVGENGDLTLLSQMGRNKSLDEGMYAEKRRKGIRVFESSHSTDSIDFPAPPHQYDDGNISSSGYKTDDDEAFLNGHKEYDESKYRVKTQLGGKEFVPVIRHQNKHKAHRGLSPCQAKARELDPNKRSSSPVVITGYCSDRDNRTGAYEVSFFGSSTL